MPTRKAYIDRYLVKTNRNERLRTIKIIVLALAAGSVDPHRESESLLHRLAGIGRRLFTMVAKKT